jgi:hypothetical protein
MEARDGEKRQWAEEAEAERGRHREEIAALREALAAKQTEVDRFSAAYDELMEETRLLRARVLGQRALDGDITAAELEPMTDREGFDELERQLDAFVKLYGRVWAKTKRKIRKDLLNPKYIKGQSGKK